MNRPIPPYSQPINEAEGLEPQFHHLPSAQAVADWTISRVFLHGDYLNAQTEYNKQPTAERKARLDALHKQYQIATDEHLHAVETLGNEWRAEQGIAPVPTSR